MINLMGNIFSEISGDNSEEFVQILAEKSPVRIERIVSTGQCSPDGFWYDQNDDEFVILLSGSASVRFENETENRDLIPGDYLFIPTHARHRVVSTNLCEQTVWLALFF